MPIYEYSCLGCGAQFEKLVQGQAQVACPTCASARVSRRMSLVGVRTGTGRDAPAGMPMSGGGGCCGGGCGCH
jgi:putative FmdB family regulatory protein